MKEHIGKDNEKYMEEAMAYFRSLPEESNNEDEELPEEEKETSETIEEFKQPKAWSGYMDGYLRKNLAVAQKIIKKDWDMLFVIDGYEGSGKSVLAQQCAKEVDPTINIDRVCFSPKEFVTAINSAKRFQAVVYDEAMEGMSSRAAMSEINRMLMGVLAEIRQKNLWVFIVLPCFFELDKYAAVWRSRGLLHVYTGDAFERGFFAFYNQNRKKDLYMLGKKFYSYFRPKPNFRGRFPKGYVVDENDYRQKKLKALKARETEDTPENKLTKTYREAFTQALKRQKEREGLTNQILANQYGLGINTISRMLNEKKE